MRSAAHVEDLLPAYALGCLDPGELEAVRRHLERCASCRSALARYEEVVGALGLSRADGRAARRAEGEDPGRPEPAPRSAAARRRGFHLLPRGRPLGRRPCWRSLSWRSSMSCCGSGSSAWKPAGAPARPGGRPARHRGGPRGPGRRPLPRPPSPGDPGGGGSAALEPRAAVPAVAHPRRSAGQRRGVFRLAAGVRDAGGVRPAPRGLLPGLRHHRRARRGQPGPTGPKVLGGALRG